MTPDERLAAIYDRIPAIDCKGACHTSCGPVGASAYERQRLAERGVSLLSLRRALTLLAVGKSPDCPALTPLGRCSVYDVRPLICRLWGVVEDMPCTYGCVPERYLTSAEARQMLAEAGAS